MVCQTHLSSLLYHSKPLWLDVLTQSQWQDLIETPTNHQIKHNYKNMAVFGYIQIILTLIQQLQ